MDSSHLTNYEKSESGAPSHQGKSGDFRSTMKMMNLYAILAGLFLVLAVHPDPACGCRRSSTNAPSSGQTQRNDPIADIWIGRLPFINYMCGWPNDTTPVRVGIVRRQLPDPFNLFPKTLEPLHTMVYFRGQVFEWGAGLLRSYANGTLDRDPHGCPIDWHLYGQSNCSLAEIQRVATTFMPRYGPYHLLQNNCHHFTGLLGQKLVRGECSAF